MICFKKVAYSFYCDYCRFFFRETIDSGADVGECNGLALIADCELKRILITTAKFTSFIMVPVSPYRPHSMNNKFGRQLTRGCDNSFSCFTTSMFSYNFFTLL